MSYRIESDANNEYRVIFESEPVYCHSLKMKPNECEKFLNESLWLILGFAIWSSPDRDAIQDAIDIVKNFNSQVNLGVRPFDHHEEFQTWRDDTREKHGSPIWLILKGGKKIEELVGIHTKDEIIQILNRLVKDKRSDLDIGHDGREKQ